MMNGILLKSTMVVSLMMMILMYFLTNQVSGSSGGLMGGSDWDPPPPSDDSTPTSYSYSYSYSPPYHDSRPSSDGAESSPFAFWGFTFAAGVIMLVLLLISKNTAKTSVIMLQIGLFGNIRPLQIDLNQIARTANTSTRRGMRSVLTGTLESLIAHHKSCISAYSSSNILSSTDEGKKMFNELSSSEQKKFDEVTMVNLNNMRSERKESTIVAEASDMYLVVTILVAGQGRFEVSSINTSEELIEALQKLLSISENETMAVRVLWTPQQELDTLSNEQLLEDYPLLRPLRTT